MSFSANQSQCSLGAVSVESPFAEDSPCFATLRRLHGDCAETAVRIIRGGVADKVAKCDGGIPNSDCNFHFKLSHFQELKDYLRIKWQRLLMKLFVSF